MPPAPTMPSLPDSYWLPIGAQAIPFPSHPPLQGQEAAQVSVEHSTNHEHRRVISLWKGAQVTPTLLLPGSLDLAPGATIVPSIGSHPRS